VAQFDVFRISDGVLVVDLQTDLIGLDASRIVAPLRPEGQYAVLPGLTPMVDLLGQSWIVRIPELAAIPRRELRENVGTLEANRDTLKRALDILIDGF